MEYLHSQDGHPFIRAVAQYIRQHEKALANSLQLHVQRRKPSPNTTALGSPTGPGSVSQASTSTLAAALSFAGLNFRSHSVKSAQLTLTPHHLFYLLSRIEELEVDIGPMNIRMESIHSDSSPANYVSFLQTHKAPKGRSDADSIHSVSSIRSVMSGMSALWSAMGVSNGSKSEKARLALENDMKYIYGAFTKLPCLRLTPDHRTPLIKGYEQFPFDTAVPLFAFKNLQQLEIIDLDFRTFYGWDRLAEQLRLLTIKRGNLDDPIDLLEHIVLDDAEKRRRRSNRSYVNAPSTPSWSVPSTPRADYARSQSDGGSPERTSPGTSPGMKAHREDYAVETTPVKSKNRTQSTIEGTSPKRPAPRRPASSYRHVRTYSLKAKRSGSGSSNNSDSAYQPGRDDASTNAAWNVLPASKWQRLVYLSLADNGLTLLPERSLQAVAPSLRSLNLSSNLFTEIPDGLARLSRLQSLDLSNCMIESLRSLAQHPLPAVTTLKLKSNRLSSIAGIEHLHSLENLHLQDNKITDPDEAARLTGMPNFRRLWIKHNPLTKSYYDFRVRIMNHFRRTPGFLEDIVLDDQPATFSERKQLVERVAEAEPPPVSQPDVAKQKVVLVQEPPRNPQLPTEAGNRLSLVTNLQKVPSGASARRKNGPKRRIIDLSADEANSPIKDRSLEDAGITSVAISENTVATNSSSAMESMLFIPRFTPPQIPVDHDEMAKTLTKNSSSGDDYRFNVEDLRLKFGNTWLSALGDQHVQWPSESDLTTLCATHQPPKLHHYHSSPPVLDVGTGMP